MEIPIIIAPTIYVGQYTNEYKIIHSANVHEDEIIISYMVNIPDELLRIMKLNMKNIVRINRDNRRRVRRFYKIVM